jgi:hypothetical protein
MSTIAIRNDEVFFGYRANDDYLLFTGAVPADTPTDEILEKIKADLNAARAGRDAHRAARKG